jgi:hypothetical protein
VTGNGILAAGGPGNWWAWAGARLAPVQAPPAPPVPPDPAPPLGGQHFSGSAHTVLQSRDIHGNVVVNLGPRHGAPPDLVPWLGAVWQNCVEVGASVELRLLNSAERTLSAYLLCRVAAPEESLALATAARLRATLPAGLPQLTADPVLDQPRLGTVLEPFVPHQQGIVEIRKRLTAAYPTRRDARLPVLAAVTPLDGGTTSWQEMWSVLAAFPAPALLSVRLQPFRVGPGLLSRLDLWSGEFARLAVPGVPPNPTWPEPPPPDRFAVHAAPLYAAALRRYTEMAFEIRVSLASSTVVPDDAARLLANTISPPHPGAGFAGDAPVIVRPRTPEHATVAWRNITVLSADPIGPVAPDGFPDESIGDVARALTTIADIHEAASVFRPPYPVDGSSTPFGG